MRKKFIVSVYGMPSQEINVSADELQEIVFDAVEDLFVDVAEAERAVFWALRPRLPARC